ncbi:PREDICTED: keratin, type I cuticular Ha8-like [Ceratotherium simum simum]|uniref:Keratin, type I cuticular Ha8-like n=1 Tax=Ceratotherium simum simum TaxID=73337 RepID=A0ABM1D2Q6_CERSS|nr:PREDICTED: keratin, type I cuticular Ha8-like [Ceratotherium simum simum]
MRKIPVFLHHHSLQAYIRSRGEGRFQPQVNPTMSKARVWCFSTMTSSCCCSLLSGEVSEAKAARPCLSATLAHANCVCVGTTPLGQSSLCLPHSCSTACPLSTTCNIPGNSGICGTCGEGTLNSHEKVTMQFLNDRLANNLEKVHQLEWGNAELETKILESSKCHESNVCLDYQSYFRTIEELQKKILCIKSENNKLVVQTDNAKLAADDFRTNWHQRWYQVDHSLCQLVEADICGLRRVLDHLTLAECDLEAQLESLRKELLCLKKNHEQEVHTLKCQLGDKLQIELDTEPTADLGRLLEEIWYQYEAMVNTSEGISLLDMSCSEELQCCQMEILELRRMVNALEKELQAQHKLIQSLISSMQEQLSEIRADLKQQNQEYQVLLDAKA